MKRCHMVPLIGMQEIYSRYPRATWIGIVDQATLYEASAPSQALPLLSPHPNTHLHCQGGCAGVLNFLSNAPATSSLSSTSMIVFAHRPSCPPHSLHNLQHKHLAAARVLSCFDTSFKAYGYKQKWSKQAGGASAASVHLTLILSPSGRTDIRGSGLSASVVKRRREGRA